MFEYFEFIPVVPAQTRQGAKPHKAFAILKDTVDLVVRKSIGDVEAGELKLIILRLQKVCC